MKYRSRASLLLLFSLFTADAALAQNRSDRKPVAFVRRLTLIDAATKGPVSELRDGMSIRLADVPEDRLDILAETYPRRVDSVTFKLLEQGTRRSDVELPFTLRGGKGQRHGWRAKPGLLTLVVQPFQNGSPGIPLRMKVNFLGDGTAPEVTAKTETPKAVDPAPREAAPESRARLAEPIVEVVAGPPPEAEEIAVIGRQVEPPPAPSQGDRCRAMLRPGEGRLTVVCSHTLGSANSAQLVVRGDGADEGELPLCQFENAANPIVTSCAYLENQLERLEVRIRSAEGKERTIPVEVD